MVQLASLTETFVSSYYHSSKESTSVIVSALLKLSTKYSIDCVRNEAIKHLALRFPSTRADYQHYFHNEDDNRPFCFRKGAPYEWLRLARLVNAEVLLPVLYFEVAIEPLQSILAQSSRGGLFGNDLDTILLGREALQLRHKEKLVTLVNGKAPGACRSRCIQGTRSTVWLDSSQCNLKFSASGIHEYDAFLASFINDICSTCYHALLDAYMAELDKTWDNLPSYFGLPPWETLRSQP